MLRPLPRLVAPFRDETITSYLHRLAGPNHIDPAGLRPLLTRQRPQGRPGAARPARRRGRDALAVTGLRHAADLHPGRTVRPAIASRPRARDGWSFAACRPCAAGQPVTRWALHDEVICRRHRRWISKDHDQPDLTAPAGDPARAPAAPAADPPPRPGPGHARAARRTPHLHRLAPGRAARPGLRPPHGDLLRPRLGRPRRLGAPGLSTRPPTRNPSPWPGCSPARTGAHASSAPTGPGTTNSPPNYAAPSPPATPGTTRLPAGAAAGTTRCSNGDWIPAASSSSRSRPAINGTCPKPSSRPHWR